MAEKAQLRVGDKTYELDIIEGSEGERAIEVVNGHQTLIETSLFDRHTGATLGFGSQRIERLAPDAFE